MKSNGVWKNKKAVVVVAILVLVLLAGGTYVATRNTDSHNKAKTTTQSEEKAKKEKEDKKEQKEAEKALEEAKASGDEKAIKEAEAKVEKAQAKIKASLPSGGSTQNSSAPASDTPKPADKKKVWVVDKAAWTETVTKYRTETVTKYYYNGQYYDTYEEGYFAYAQDGDNGIAGGSLSPVNVEVQVPYTETINHPEEGHWEYR